MSKPSKLPNQVEQRIIRQCMEAILFEKLLPYEEYDLEEGWKQFIVQGSIHTYQCLGKRSAFDRVRLQGMPLKKDKGSQAIPTIDDLIGEAPLTHQQKKVLMHELKQTALLSEWNEQHLVSLRSRRELSYEQLEASLTEGHPYHPCFKARTGFALEDHQRYGNEAKATFQLVWLGIKKEDVKTYYPEEEHSFLQKEFGHQTWKQVVEALCQAGGQLYEYRLMPIHPWQWSYLKEEVLEDELQTKDILFLGTFGDQYGATQSLRTLLNHSDVQKAHVKLPLHVMNTSSVRTIQSESIAAAAPISQWLQTIVEQDSFFYKHGDVRILKEYAGASYETAKNPRIKDELNVLFRDSVTRHIQDGEQAIPFNALSMIENDGLLFIDTSLNTYGIKAWLTQLVNVSVIPIIHLCVEHGIALEAHGQNVILIQDNGWPKGIMLRDFHESLEYYEPFSRNKDAIPDFSSLHKQFQVGKMNDYYWMSSVEALRELVVDTLFVYHLTELSWQLDAVYGFKEDSFWTIVSRCLNNYREKNALSKVRFDSFQFFSQMQTAESLFRKKWQNDGATQHLIRNGLQMEEVYVTR
ncbi:siderophore biosynthesis protein [Alkalihalobacillus sp. LMS6]|uniref:IucA/IucC family protein n=1 Tax=Alkalihalobacillus sp. LMS6 TaxID=2924034 RepID=UPI0020CFF1F2|nr:IucA/IucC family protein [Alkalihalobacillus sp. LMS6]UTR08058.1 siderophore biosynthesis protein [Alkalihalobacillus sp. LMS6]